MAFAITPGRLETYADGLDAIAAEATAGKEYLSKHMSLGFVDTSFLYYNAKVAADRAEETLATWFLQSQSALTASATELRGTAQRSRDLDDAVEADLDAAYPDASGPRPPMTPPSDQSGSATPGDPGDLLTAPSDLPDLDLVSEILTTDWLSPSTVLAWVLDQIFDWNYLDVIATTFSGDWNALHRITSALENVDRHQSSMAENVTYGMSVTASSWKGEGADAANAFFTEFARMIREGGDEIGTLAPEFAIVAQSMRDTADAVAGLFAQILDGAIVAALAITGGTLLIETVIGAIVGYLIAAVDIGYMVWLAHSAWEVIQAAVTFFDILSGSVGVLAQFFISNPELPTPTPYDNPDVP